MYNYCCKAFKKITGKGERMRYKIAILAAVTTFLNATIKYNIENNNSVTVVNQKIGIENLPKEFEGFTILQVTDLHSKSLGESQEGLTELINELKFDIIAITGDMQNRQDNDYEKFIALLKGINNKEEIFYTPGNHGPMVYKDEVSFNSFTKRNINNYKGKEVISNNSNRNKDNLSNNNDIGERELTEAGIKMKELGVKFLDNVYSIKKGKEILWVSELIYSDEFNELAKGKYNENDIKLALTHYPMNKRGYEGDIGKFLGRYDLVLAGHYHGGQWRIPYVGGIFIPDLNQSGWFPSKERISGLTKWGGFKQYVSRGIGAGGAVEILRFRFFNKPEINLIKLVKKTNL
ncbi:metallophosphoesterase [Clostridium gasigenes]|nr:metallophosphoesterase [Clostridium gasigenes]